MDQREFDDRRQDVPESGQEGEASQVALEVVQGGGDPETETDGREHPPLELEVFRGSGRLFCTGEEGLGCQSFRNFAAFVELGY